MPPRKIVRTPQPHILNQSDSGSEDQEETSSPDPLDVISNESPEAEQPRIVYRTRRVSQNTSPASSRSVESSATSRSSIKRKRVFKNAKANGDENDSDQQSSRKESSASASSSRRSSLDKPPSPGTKATREEGEDEQEDEWATFLSNSDTKRRLSEQSNTHSTDSGHFGDDIKRSNQKPTSDLLQLSPVRRRLANMSAEERSPPPIDTMPENENGMEGKEGCTSTPEEGVQSGQEPELETEPRGDGEENGIEASEQPSPEVARAEGSVLDHGEAVEKANITQVDEAQPEVAAEITGEEQADDAVATEAAASMNTAPPTPREPETVATQEIAVFELQEEMAPNPEIDTALDVEAVNQPEPQGDGTMDVDDPADAVEHAVSTPATFAPDVEEGEEEIDEDVPESEHGEVEPDTEGDIEMGDGSTPVSMPATDGGKAKPAIKKKAGPKAKPMAGKKTDAASKKSKDTKMKSKVGDLKSSKSKTARFTPDSVNQSSASVASVDATRQGSPDSTTDRRYCVCRKKESEDDDEVTMVGCESCDDWFHPACVGLTEDQVANLDVYICRSCERSTKQKTVYKKTCKRNGCDKGLGTRESKFCSDLCAYKHMKAFTDSITNKKTIKQLSVSFGSYPKPPQANIQLHNTAQPAPAREDQAQQLINTIQTQLEATTAALEIVRKRQQILQVAIDRAETLPPIIIQAEENRGSKSKRKGGNGPTEDKQCAWDARLIWDDAEVQSWDGQELEDAENGICGLAKRKCDRHQGWQKTSAISLELEHAQLSKQRKALSNQEAELIKEIEATAESERARIAFHDRLAAKGKTK